MSKKGPSSMKRTRYMLRSSNGNENCDAEHNEPTDRKRKRKGLQLMDLNDDCLLAIMECMKAVELVDIAEICKRAQALAQNTFRLKHHRLDLTTIEGINLKLTMRLLRNFGGVISSLNIAPRRELSLGKMDKSPGKILTLIGRHCHTNLTELSLKNIHMTSVSMVHVGKVFGSLKTLVLKNCCFVNSDLRSLNKHLEVMKLNCVNFVDSTDAFSDNYKPLTTFLTKAQALKQLELQWYKSDDGLIESISKLKTIKVLGVSGMCFLNDSHILTLAKGLKSLTELNLNLDSPNCITRRGIVDMLREAVRLSRLDIESIFVLGIDTYDDMLKIIKNRPEHIKLELTFFCYEPFDPDGTLRSNDKWLSLKETLVERHQIR